MPNQEQLRNEASEQPLHSFDVTLGVGDQISEPAHVELAEGRRVRIQQMQDSGKLVVTSYESRELQNDAQREVHGPHA